MTLIEEIKARLDLVEIASSYLQLQAAGSNWKALCPFHAEKTPSLVLFPQAQRWKCFGISCGKSGDVFDLLQQLQGWDFAHTLRYLAAKAGVTLPDRDTFEQGALEGQRERQHTLSTAMQFFQECMSQPHLVHLSLDQSLDCEKGGAAAISAGIAYAYSRGWSDETISAAGLGCFGRDWEGLRRHLKSAGVDLESPLAVALLGLRGDVAAWGASFNLQLAQAWITERKIPAIPPQLLLYPHLVRGRMVYLSGRSLVGKGHWNPPSQLLGARQPFYNHLFWRPPEHPPLVVVVEGQADAVTMAQWGLPAVALLGANL
jgi:DNA primase